MIRKIFTVFLSLLLLITGFPVFAFASDPPDDEPPVDTGEAHLEPAIRPAHINSILLAYLRHSPSCLGVNCNFIEIFNASDEDLEVDNIRIEFYNSSYNLRSGTTIDTGRGVFTARGSILLKPAGFDYTYNVANIVKSGGAVTVTTTKDDVEARSIACWGSNSGCRDKLKLPEVNMSIGVDWPIGGIFVNTRLFTDYDVDEYFSIITFTDEHIPSYGGFIANDPIEDDPSDPGPPAPIINPCSLIKINEISFADSHKFIEFVNESNETISTVNCAVKRGATKSNLDRAIYLDAIFKPGEIKTFDIIGTTMTQSNANVAIAVYDKLNNEMVMTKDENGEDVVYQVQYIKVKENASYAWFDDEERTGWFQTFVPTPGAENIYQQFQNCPNDKMINPDTGNCMNIPLPPVDCPFGQYRNPETGRCKKLPEETIYVPCQEGYYRNLETNRCRKIETETSQKECQEGWERNPETNRCRKKTDNSPAGFAVQNTGPTPESNMLIGFASGGAAVTGTLITASYRQDFMNFIRKFMRKK